MTIGGYPPPHHILADLGLDAFVESETSARVRTRVTPHILGTDGGVRAGVLATLVDVVGGAVGVRALHPDWMATADLTLQVVRPARGPIVEARATVLRGGRTTLVIEAGVFDVADGDPDPTGYDPILIEQDSRGTGAGPEGAAGDAPGSAVAWATMTFAILAGGRRSAPPPTEVALPDRWSFTGPGLDVPVVEALGMAVTDADEVSLPVQEYLFNSIGAVQGGVVALLGEVAGIAALAAATGADAPVVTDLQVAYLSPGRVGPIVSRTKVLGTEAGAAGGSGGHGRRLAAVVELLDVGAEDRLTAVINVGATTATAAPNVPGATVPTELVS